MMNLRFTIYDLRLAFSGKRPPANSLNRKSSIINHKFTATHLPAATR